ncbi:MAG: hemolysin family protein [Oscillospiraceae bacterium]|nr:hemolysin family protein [Oscillospiraceae bacterium]
MKYAAIMVLIVMSAFFSSIETAFTSVNKIRLKGDAENGNKRAVKTLAISQNFDKALTTILVGNNIVNILSTSLGTVLCSELFGARGVGVATFFMTVLILVFGEILPKSIAKQNAEKTAITFTPVLSFLMTVLTPVTAIFACLQRFVSNCLKSDKSPSVTEDELKYIIDEIEGEGVLEEQESDLVRSALEFDEKNVSEILIPRVKIQAVEKSVDIESIKELFFSEQYSRMPVYEKNIDNIIGFIHERDFFRMITENPDADSIESIIHELIYISEFKTISEVLAKMQKEKVHIAIVKDQYGGTYGMVTMEDIIEELFGEIYDETDEVSHDLVPLSDNVYEANAELNIDSFLDALDLPEDTIENESYTLGGWAMELFGRIPDDNDEVSEGIFTLKVLEAEDNRIVKLKVTVNRE